MRKLSNTEAELKKKALLIKKCVIMDFANNFKDLIEFNMKFMKSKA